MQFPDNRGKHKLACARKNKLAVAEYFRTHPDARQRDCAKALGLSIATIQKHVRDMRENGVPDSMDSGDTNA